jgi:hypothetical protein
MKVWAHIVRRVGLVAALVGASALTGCATYYDSSYYNGGYYEDAYGNRGDYYTDDSYYGYDDYGYGSSYYYGSVLWPTWRYYDPWYSPYWYGGYPYSGFGFSLGYYDPFYYPGPYRYGSYGWYGHHGYGHHGRHDRRNVNRGDWRPRDNDDPYRRGDYRQGSAADETARLANRRGIDRPLGRTYADPDRQYRSLPSQPMQPSQQMPQGDWRRSRDGGSGDGYSSRRIEQMERPGAERFERAPAYQPAPRAEPRAQRYEPRAEPRFEQRQEAPRFSPPPVSDSGRSRGRDEDSGREPQ